jgi:hypothetical protein
VCKRKDYNTILKAKHLYDGLRDGDVLSPLTFNFAYGIRFQEGPRELGGIEIEWDTSAFVLC